MSRQRLTRAYAGLLGVNAIFSPRAQTILSWVLLIGALIGWPVTARTIFADEPQGILGLSWLAIIVSSFGNLVSTQVNEEVQAAAPLASADENREEGDG